MTNPNDHPPLYKLRVSTHAGTFRHELVLDSLWGLMDGQQVLNLTDGPALEVRPGGDCRQASFSGVGADLDIGYRDLVEVLWSDDRGGSWKARWAGYADTVAPARDPEPGPYVLYGLRQRLDQVEARKTIAQDYPNRQFAQLMNDLIDSGQIGQALNRTPVPEIGVGEIRPAIVPRYESVLQVADKWLAASSGSDTTESQSLGLSDYGVDATRTPIWGTPDGTHILDEADGVLIQGQAGSSARLRTHIRATFVAPGRGPYLYFSQSLLAEQEGTQATALIQVADPAAYGYSSAREILEPLARYFTRAPCVAVQARWTAGSGYSQGGTIQSGNATLAGFVSWVDCALRGSVESLNDGDLSTSVAVIPPVNPDATTPPWQGGTFLVEVTYSPGPVPFGVAVHAVGGIVTGFVFDEVLDVRCSPDENGFLLFPDEVRQWITDHWDPQVPSKCAIRIARTGTGGVNLTTFGALFLDEARVRSAVRQYAHLPVPDPETFRVPGWDVAPLAYVIGVYRNPDGTEQERSAPRQVDVYRYVVDADGQQWTEVQVAQGDDADDQAARAQIERIARTEAVKAALGR